MNAKRMLALVLALMMVLALTACGNTGGNEKAEAEKEAEIEAAENGTAASCEALVAAVEKVYNDGDATAADVDKEVMEILKESYEEAKRLLSAHRNTLDQIAEFLIKRETITGKEFMDIFHRVEGIDPEAEKEQESSRISERKTDSVIILPDLQAEA